MLLPIIKQAATIAGNGVPNISALARKIKAPRPALYVWKQVPAAYCLAIHKATGGKIKLWQIRPDLYTKGM